MIAIQPEIIFATGCAGILIIVCLAFWLILRKQATLRSEMQSHIDSRRDECHQEIAALAENVATLERSAQQIAEAKGDITRSIRSQALQLLRSGMSSENTAAALGMGTNEVRLLATVSRSLRL